MCTIIEFYSPGPLEILKFRHKSQEMLWYSEQSLQLYMPEWFLPKMIHLASYDADFNIEEKPPTPSELHGWLAMKLFSI